MTTNNKPRKRCRKCNRVCWGTYCSMCYWRKGARLGYRYVNARRDIRLGIRKTTSLTI